MHKDNQFMPSAAEAVTVVASAAADDVPARPWSNPAKQAECPDAQSDSQVQGWLWEPEEDVLAFDRSGDGGVGTVI